MNDSEPRRRDVLVAVSGGCVALAGCADWVSGGSGYGTAYGDEYGAE